VTRGQAMLRAPRFVAPALLVTALAAALPCSPAAAQRTAAPEHLVIHDTRTSAPTVDISRVRADASWYWDSEQDVIVTVPNGFQPGHLLTVWFDVNGDSTADGHYELSLGAPRKAGGKELRRSQVFRRGGGWGHGGSKARCGGSEGGPPVIDPVRRGQRSISISLDLWWCLGKTPPNIDVDPGSWRIAVRVAKGEDADMAPNGRTWSKPVRGWGPCDPSGGPCP